MNPEDRFVRLCRKHHIEVEEIPGRTYAVRCRLCCTTDADGRKAMRFLDTRHWGTWDRQNQCWWGEEPKKTPGKGIAPLLATVFDDAKYAVQRAARPRAE